MIGVAGAKRHGCVAVWRDGAVQGACEVERVTRTRGDALPRGEWPTPVLDALGALPCADDHTLVIAEQGIVPPAGITPVRFDHHEAHAAMAFLTSPFARALVVVCDSRFPGVSVWKGDGSTLTRMDWPWSGPSFARLYSMSAEALGLGGAGRERIVEALARGVQPHEPERLACFGQYDRGDHRVALGRNWPRRVASWAAHADGCRQRLAGIAASLQARLGTLFLDALSDIVTCAGRDWDAVCLGGGFFQNTYFTSLVRRSGLLARVFVPVNPGNAGLALGNLLAAAAQTSGRRPAPPCTPFIGPGFPCEEIKATLDNCKLTYRLLSESQLIDETVDALRRGHLVGWFQGRMEWGPRALGHRSILANPVAGHALENLNIYLKKRRWYQAFSVSALEEDLDRHFDGPAASPHMEYEYAVRNPDLLRAVVPAGATALRVQSVGRESGLFRRLLEAFSAATGAGVLVNTSFNGFSEPMVCTPRDAIRVFYGTGLDVLVMGRFVLRK
jgi:carbamoyltransferase